MAFIKLGQQYLNTDQVSQIVTKGDGTAWLYYSGGDDHYKLNLGANEAAAIAALNTALTPIDFTSSLVTF